MRHVLATGKGDICLTCSSLVMDSFLAVFSPQLPMWNLLYTSVSPSLVWVVQ